MLSAPDLDRIAEAVKAAEARTSGEVFCLFAHEVSDYREVPLAWGVAASLILPPLAVASGLYERVLDALQGWTAAHGVSDAAATAAALTSYAVLQATLFGLVWALVSIPAVRRPLTPRRLKARRVKRLAQQLFTATGMKDDPTRTGVLIFAAFAERRVELLADEAIHRAAAPGAWDRAVAAVTRGMKTKNRAEGFVEAITVCGDALAKAFPGGGNDANRLGDRPIEV